MTVQQLTNDDQLPACRRQGFLKMGVRKALVWCGTIYSLLRSRGENGKDYLREGCIKEMRRKTGFFSVAK